MYDESGLEGMKNGGGMAPDADLADLLNHMFGPGVAGFGGGMGGMGDMSGGRKSRDAVQEFEVSLEDLYKGKQVKMMSKRKVVCTTCKGYDLTSTRMGVKRVGPVGSMERNRKSVLLAVEQAKKSWWACSTNPPV